jgi:hypothetical protein
MTATTEECNARGRSQTQRERGPGLYPVPNVPTEVGADIPPHHFDDCLAQLRPRHTLYGCEPCPLGATRALEASF